MLHNQHLTFVVPNRVGHHYCKVLACACSWVFRDKSLSRSSRECQSLPVPKHPTLQPLSCDQGIPCSPSRTNTLLQQILPEHGATRNSLRGCQKLDQSDCFEPSMLLCKLRLFSPLDHPWVGLMCENPSSKCARRAAVMCGCENDIW